MIDHPSDQDSNTIGQSSNKGLEYHPGLGLLPRLILIFFWNSADRRIRAFWRLTIQILLYLLISISLAGFIYLVFQVIFPELAASKVETSSQYLIISSFSPILSLLGIFFSVWAAGKWLDHRKFSDFGFHLNVQFSKDLIFGLLLGAFLMTLVFGVEYAAGWITVTQTMQTSLEGIPFILGLVQSVILFVCVGIYEELFSRGYQLRNLAEGFNMPRLGPQRALIIGWSLSSLIFGVLHASNPNATLISTANIVVAGLFLGLGYILTGKLAISIGLHITWNFFQGNVFGFPVSGTSPGVKFISILQGGPDMFTGGAFGPEAGILGLLAMVAGSILTIIWVRKFYGRVKLQDGLASYQIFKTGD